MTPDRERLFNWSQLADRSWPSLLLGNGLSINIWRRFAYAELREQAELESAAAQLFADLDTVNFEEVLEGLWHAERVVSALQQDPMRVSALYAHVRAELVRTIQRVHIPWGAMPSMHLNQIATALDGHRFVFTLNYDLLTYWALMGNLDTTGIVDFFWNNPFDPSNTGLKSARLTGLLFLHGGIHLWLDSVTGETGKWTNQEQGGLLSQLSTSLEAHPDRQPLMISEGRSEQKMRAIRRSEYLSFAYQQLVENSSNTVIFGTRFGDQDAHIVDALRAGGTRDFAVAVLPGTRVEVAEAMGWYRAKLPDQNLWFFDSTTHPVGDLALHVPES
jgi:Domain of unknown function (DUF4917)